MPRAPWDHRERLRCPQCGTTLGGWEGIVARPAIAWGVLWLRCRRCEDVMPVLIPPPPRKRRAATTATLGADDSG